VVKLEGENLITNFWKFSRQKNLLCNVAAKAAIHARKRTVSYAGELLWNY